MLKLQSRTIANKPIDQESESCP